MGWRGMGAERRLGRPRRAADDPVSRSGGDAGPPDFQWGTEVSCGSRGARRTRALPRVGQRYGELTVIGYCYGARGGVTAVVTECSCGRRPYRTIESNLHYGRTTRCNTCAKKQSGYWKKTYCGYADIIPDDRLRSVLLDRISACINRCHNPNDRNFKHYGGRGIFVHGPWRKDRRKYLRYLVTLDGWNNTDLEIDRKNVNKGYRPGNLRFATRAQNQSNRRQVSVMQQRILELEARLRRCKCGA